jgi:CubicO group peptidase (beta-lactamase class C family)
MLRQRNWAGQQVVSRELARRITSLAPPLNEMNSPELRSLGTGSRWGYDYMWWVWDAPNSPGPFEGVYTGMGAGGQYITVLPKLDMVIAHKTEMGQPPAQGPNERRRNVPLAEYDSVIRMLIAARCSGGERQ